jgi:hypothetical protein
MAIGLVEWSEAKKVRDLITPQGGGAPPQRS